MKQLRQKWIPDLPLEKYHWGEPFDSCLNNSKLKLLEYSPAHAHAVTKDNPTKALRIGTYLHDLLLMDTDVKQMRAVYKEDEVDLAADMAAAVMRHKKASKIIKHADKEMTGIYKDPDFGFWCKIRTDLKLDKHGIIGDIKSTNSHFSKFKKDIFWFKYPWQGWLYLRGANTLSTLLIGKKIYHTFLLIVVEKKPPHGVVIYKLSKATLDAAEQEVMPLLELYKNCLDTGKWPSYPEEIVEV
jgi:hypothetical protein